MKRGIRYLLYSAIFAIVLVGLFIHSGAWLISLLLLAVLLGLLVDRVDNRRDEPFKKYNSKHHHLHRHAE